LIIAVLAKGGPDTHRNMWREQVMRRDVCCCALVVACALGCSRGAFAQEAAPPAAARTDLGALEARIEAVLGETTSLQFLEQPLGDVVAFLEDHHKIEIQLDHNALDSAGVNTDSPVTIDVEGISLRSALNLMLKSIDLTYCVRDGVLLVTTTEEVEDELVTKVYDARRFLYVTDKYGERKRDSEPLFDLVTTHVRPSDWMYVGGMGSIDFVDQSAVVSQSWSTQREVADFMTALETALSQYKEGAFNAPIDVGATSSGSSAAIRHALGETTSLQFLEQPLTDIVAFLEDRHKIEIQLDTSALDTAGVNKDTQATIDVEGIPLGSALKLMLEQLDLTYTIRDEVLLITTKEEVEQELTTRIYPVKDLIAADKSAGATATAVLRRSLVGPALMSTGTPPSPSADAAASPSDSTGAAEVEGTSGAGAASAAGFPAEELKDYGQPVERILQAVTNAVEPSSWTEVGGTGSISYVPEFEGIVVSQTQATHDKIDALLADLRRMRDNQTANPEGAADDGSAATSLRSYRALFGKSPVKETGKLALVIQRNVEPAAWANADEHSVVTIDDVLLIKTTNKNHRRIGELLSELGYVNQAIPAAVGCWAAPAAEAK